MDISISDKLDSEGKVIEKMATISMTTTKVITLSTTELLVKKQLAEKRLLAIQNELHDINMILNEVNK